MTINAPSTVLAGLLECTCLAAVSACLTHAQLVYVAFDILFDEHESLMNLPLRQRQQRLAQAVKCLPAEADAGVLLGPEGGCIRGRIVTLLPEVPLALPIEGKW